MNCGGSSESRMLFIEVPLACQARRLFGFLIGRTKMQRTPKRPSKRLNLPPSTSTTTRLLRVMVTLPDFGSRAAPANRRQGDADADARGNVWRARRAFCSRRARACEAVRARTEETLLRCRRLLQRAAQRATPRRVGCRAKEDGDSSRRA